MATTDPQGQSGAWGAEASRAPMRFLNALHLGLDGGAARVHAPTATRVEIDGDGPTLIEDEADTPGPIDICVHGDGAIDLRFDLPNGPLPDLRRMIEREIRHRSPFADTAHAAFWQASETPDGTWRIDAAILMGAVLDRAHALIEGRGGRPGRFHRIGPDLSYSAEPATDLPAPSPRRIPLQLFRAAPAPLRGAVVGAAVLLLSATFLSLDTLRERARIDDDVAAARSQIGARAAAATQARALAGVRGASRDRIALVGVLSGVLPEGVWLSQLTLDGSEVTLTGFGPSTTTVQRLLADLPYLSDVRLASSVTRDNSQSIERFRIAATLAGPIPPDPITVAPTTGTDG